MDCVIGDARGVRSVHGGHRLLRFGASRVRSVRCGSVGLRVSAASPPRLATRQTTQAGRLRHREGAGWWWLVGGETTLTDLLCQGSSRAEFGRFPASRSPFGSGRARRTACPAWASRGRAWSSARFSRTLPHRAPRQGRLRPSSHLRPPPPPCDGAPRRCGLPGPNRAELVAPPRGPHGSRRQALPPRHGAIAAGCGMARELLAVRRHERVGRLRRRLAGMFRAGPTWPR
jgi:hypothetical protein